jgi:hypothetical protein
VASTSLNPTIVAKDSHKNYVNEWHTGYTQKNGAVSKVNNNFISHLTRAQHTPSVAATVKFLMRYKFAPHAYCVAAGPVTKMALQLEKAFCVLRFEVSRAVITVQREFVHGFKKTHHTRIT